MTRRWFHDCGAEAVFTPDTGVWIGEWFQIQSGTEMKCAASCGSGSREFYWGTSRDAPDAIRAFAIPMVWPVHV